MHWLLIFLGRIGTADDKYVPRFKADNTWCVSRNIGPFSFNHIKDTPITVHCILGEASLFALSKGEELMLTGLHCQTRFEVEPMIYYSERFPRFTVILEHRSIELAGPPSEIEVLLLYQLDRAVERRILVAVFVEELEVDGLYLWEEER